MRSIVHFMQASIQFLIVVACATLLIVLRYILKTPQSLTSRIAGDPRFYTWSQGKVFYQVSGPLHAPALVLLHTPEIGGSSYEMRHLIPKLATYYRVYVPDLPGFGLSDRPALAYSPTIYQDFLKDFLTDCVTQPTILVASGLSATYSQAFANAHPDRIQRLVLLTPLQEALSSEKNIIERIAPLLHTPIGALGLYALITRKPILQRIIAWQHGETLSSVSADELNYFYASAHQRGAEHAASAWLVGDLDCQLSLQDRPQSYPILLIQGSHTTTRSSINSSSGEHHTTLTDTPEIQIATIEGSSKRAHEEQPERVLEHLLSWLHDDDTISQKQANNHPNNTLSSAPEQPKKRAESLKNTSSKLPDDQKNNIEQTSEVPSVKEHVIAESAEPSVEAYCVKCRQKRLMLLPKQVTTKNGRKAMEGTCPICGTRLFRFI